MPRKPMISLVAPAIGLGVALLAVVASVAQPRQEAVHGLRQVQTTTAAAANALPIRNASAAQTATWCGAPTPVDLAPNVVAGHPVHWVYAIPSDGADRLGTVASQMQTDSEDIDAWWRREDPARALRNDLAQLSCGTQLDVSSIRMRLSGAQLAGAEGRFRSIAEGLGTAGFDSDFTKYLVYYDGPVTEADICGQAASSPSGFGVAIVYVQACPGVLTAPVAAHELLHTLGAVPDGAPHNCPAPDDGHTCDNEADVMYPFISSGTPLAAQVLDPGRDDYYGHAAGFSDSQDAPWLVQLDRQTPFTVTISGPGQVRANVPGLQCAQTCTTTWNAGTALSLAATPGTGSKLVRWSGACTGAGGCNIATAQGATVSALFGPLAFRLSVTITGRGAVRSSRSGLTCRPRCSATFPSFTPIQITATPAKGWRFRSWAGACRGTRRTCTLPMTAATSARAVFVRRR
jgi:Divergent InlB B-repeat domain